MRQRAQNNGRLVAQVEVPALRAEAAQSKLRHGIEKLELVTGRFEDANLFAQADPVAATSLVAAKRCPIDDRQHPHTPALGVVPDPRVHFRATARRRRRREVAGEIAIGRPVSPVHHAPGPRNPEAHCGYHKARVHARLLRPRSDPHEQLAVLGLGGQDMTPRNHLEDGIRTLHHPSGVVWIPNGLEAEILHGHGHRDGQGVAHTQDYKMLVPGYPFGTRCFIGALGFEEVEGPPHFRRLPVWRRLRCAILVRFGILDDSKLLGALQRARIVHVDDAKEIQARLSRQQGDGMPESGQEQGLLFGTPPAAGDDHSGRKWCSRDVFSGGIQTTLIREGRQKLLRPARALAVAYDVLGEGTEEILGQGLVRIPPMLWTS
mmetsp:Transcript_18667/g.70617  ORF Transcript_18667/g.70617 Transcript_18667/m.70617 type:complete len:376 (-) Transcript_18667:229-1356(-)